MYQFICFFYYLLILRHSPVVCFPSVLVYSCPEESAVRLKMTYSSSKASVVAAAADVGITVDHMVRLSSCLPSLQYDAPPTQSRLVILVDTSVYDMSPGFVACAGRTFHDSQISRAKYVQVDKLARLNVLHYCNNSDRDNNTQVVVVDDDSFLLGPAAH